MPRTARIVLPNYPHHIIQRGHNRQTVFAGEDDFRYYLDNLAEFKEAFACKVYSFCLMNNHVHLIIDPGDQPGQPRQIDETGRRAPDPATSTASKGAPAHFGRGASGRVQSTATVIYSPVAVMLK